MVAAVTGTLSQGGMVVVADSPALSSDISQLQAVTVYNIPAVAGRMSQVQGIVVADNPALTAQVSQAAAVVVWRGRVAFPTIRAWTYTLDGHDYYVIQLGSTGDTLVYDLSSEQWSVFGDADTSHWRPPCGINWIDSGVYSRTYNSDVIVGDDDTGSLYFLDPEYPYDDDRYSNIDPPLEFVCKASGQVLAKGLEAHPCGVVRLLGSFGEPYNNALGGVELKYSDDAGRTYVSAGTVTIADGDYAARVEWRQTGSIKPPGRIFQIIDTGAVTRIDTLEILDEQPSEPSN